MSSYRSSTGDMVRTESTLGWGAKQGAIGGLVAGIVFAMFEMVMAAVLNGLPAFFMPLRMIGAIALGPQALDPSYSLITAGIAGLVIHMMLSIVYGVIFGAVVAAGRPMALTSTTGVVVGASIFGLLLWLVNFFVIAPVFFPWFTQSNQVVQFVAHTFLFGSVLGMYLNRVGLRRAVV